MGKALDQAQRDNAEVRVMADMPGGNHQQPVTHLPLRHSVELYRALVENMDQGFCVFEMLYGADGQPYDYRFLEVNSTFERHTGLVNAVGKTARELVPELEAYWVEVYAKVAATGERLYFEQGSQAMGRWFAVEAMRIGGVGSPLVALLFTDITGRKRRERNTQFLNGISEDLNRLSNVDAMMHATARAIGTFLSVERCALTEIDTATNTVLVHHVWRKDPDDVDFAGRYQVSDSVSDDMRHTLMAGKPMVVNDVTTDPRILHRAEIYKNLNIGSFLTMPYPGDGVFSALLVIYRRAPYQWRPDEIELLRDLTTRVWTQIERARAEAALRKSEERFRAVQETSIDGFMMLESVRDADQRIVDFRWFYANNAAEQIVGKPREWFIGRQLLEEMPGNRSEGLFDAYVRVVETGESWTKEFAYAHEGLDQYFRIVAVKVGDGFAVSFADLSERRRAEERVRESDERYRAFVANSSEGVYRLEFNPPVDTTLSVDAQVDLVYRNGQFAECNDAFARMYKFERADEIVGRGLELMLPPDEPSALAYIRSVIEAGYRVSDAESAERDRDGNTVYFANALTGVIENGMLVRGWGVQRNITDRKLAAAQLQESEERLRTLAATIPQLIWTTAVDGTLDYLSEQWTVYTGFSHDRIYSEGWHQLVHPDDLSDAINESSRCLRMGEPLDMKSRLRHHSGQWRWQLVRGVPIKDEDGRFVKWFGTCTDIHEQEEVKRDAQFLAEVAEQIRLADNPAALSYKVVQLLGAYLQVSRCYIAEIFEDANRWSIHDDYHIGVPSMRGDYQLSDYPPALRTASRNGQVLVVNDVVHDPRTATSVSAYALGERHAFIAVPLLRAGQWVSSLVVAMNRPRQWERREVALLETIAERVWLAIERLRLEVAQREYAMRLQQLNSASLAINTAITTEAVLRETTEQARALIDAHQAVTSLTIGQQWAQTITAISLSDKYAAWRSYNVPPDNSGIYSLVCRTNKPMRLTQAELEAHWAWRGFGGEAASHPPMRGWLAVPLIGRDGSNIGIIQLSDKRDGEFTAADEALLVQLAQMASVALENQQLYDQEQMARAQAEEASRLKDDFLATVSHELRTPLTSILGYAHLLHTRKRDEAYVTQTTEKILRSAQSQAQLIEDILDVSRIVSGKLRLSPQKIDLRLVIADAIDTVSPAIQAKGLQLQTVLPPEAAIVLGDPHRLQQVIWNLLSNAVKFTPNGGAVRLVLEQCDDLTDLTVSDTGRGIDPEFLPYVFDRFRQAEGSSTRAFGGLGLGLSIVRHLVELHGGSVRAHSAGVGAGAAFTVRLPTAVHDPAVVAQIQVADAAPTDATVPSELEGLRVLVVDDQPEIVELLRDLFTTCGAIVETSTDARNGLEQLRSWRPDVLISDIAMPGNDGYWLIEQIRLLAPDEGGVTPAIALTAYVRGEERTRVLTSGFQRYVPKPIEPAELRDVVASLVREHPRAGH